jgi:hypothetical protein
MKQCLFLLPRMILAATKDRMYAFYL